MGLDFDVEDIEYLKRDGQPLLARVYRPRGPGPFPCVIELHGGVWSVNDRTHGTPLHRALAGAGITVVALDFRQGAAGAYPLGVADAYAGVAWAKSNCAALKTRTDMFGVSGQSSGGQMALLLALRPSDPQYADVDGSALNDGALPMFRCMTLFWPVVHPPGRYRFAQHLAGQANAPDWAARIVGYHNAYWKTVEAMANGSPLEVLQKSPPRSLPPALLVQPKNDDLHIYRDPGFAGTETDLDRFIKAYRNLGGSLGLKIYDAPQYFTTEAPESEAARDAFARAAAFFIEHLPVGQELAASNIGGVR